MKPVKVRLETQVEWLKRIRTIPGTFEDIVTHTPREFLIIYRGRVVAMRPTIEEANRAGHEYASRYEPDPIPLFFEIDCV